jgi:adenosylhomocysteine nucleosidase
VKFQKIIVTFAVPAEFATLRRLRHFKRVTGPGPAVYAARVDRTEVFAVTTGIGVRSMHAELRKRLAESDMCIVSGLAGSLKNRHAAGAILVAKAVKWDKSQTAVSSNESLVNAATECGATAVDFFHTADFVVNSASRKMQLGESADAIEMESFHLIAEAQRYGVPAVAVRAVSDPMGDDLPLDFNPLIDGRGEIDWRPALSQIAAAPLAIPRLARFAFQSWRSAQQLGRFLNIYLNSLCSEQSCRGTVATEAR